MIVDAHVHLFPPAMVADRKPYLERDRWCHELYSSERARLASLGDLLRSMDAAGVDVSIAAAFPWADQELCDEHNAHYRTLADARIVRLCTVQPAAGQAALDELRRCLDAGFGGLGEMNVDAQGVALDDEDRWGPLVEGLVEADKPLLLHCSEPVGHVYPGKGANTPDKVYHFALAHPELRVVCAHWGGGLPFYYLMPELKPSLPNLYYDSAATEYLYDPRVFGTVSGLVGEDRVLFGSDFPLLSQRRALNYAVASGLRDDDAFFGANAAAVYCLS
ncbi:MAG: amidohydrolase family protein [Chloroflexi bacterium]|nr:amidohydrolase family protein [Chloroflexota bacterium]